MSKAKGAIKDFFAMFFCGLAAINLYPGSDYTKSVPKDALSITKAGWDMTGEALGGAIGRMGERIGK